MSTSTLERPDVRPTPDADGQPATWSCDNCHSETHHLRKRCADCGTSRY